MLNVPNLAVTTGDPSGIGPEIVVRALSEIECSVPIRIFGSWDLAAETLRRSGIETAIPVAPISKADSRRDEGVLFVDIGTDPDVDDFEVGRISRAGGRAALASIDAAVGSIESGRNGALVTAPLNKAAIRLAGSTLPGHTEILATRAGLERYAYDYAMYFDAPTFGVALLTVHVPLRDVPAAITSDKVSALARLVDREWPKLGNGRPRIALAGLNPHAGEGGLFGTEEGEMTSGIETARDAGIDVEGPFPADTLFHAARDGRYDVVIAAYHDQGLIPIKTLYFNETVNVTLGLPYLRASVDHGTAFDIAGRGAADHSAMKLALEWTMERLTR